MSNASNVTNMLRQSLEEHLQTMTSVLESGLASVESSGRVICDALAAGNKILLCGNGGRHGGSGFRKGDAERIANYAECAAAVSRDRFAQQRVVTDRCMPHGGRLPIPQRSATFDVGEQE